MLGTNWSCNKKWGTISWFIEQWQSFEGFPTSQCQKARILSNDKLICPPYLVIYSQPNYSII